MKRYFALVFAAVLLCSFSSRADGPDDLYLRIYALIQDGDTLKSNGDLPKALAKFNEAQTALQSFRRGYPDWNPKIVDFRLNYLATRISEISSNMPAASPAPAGTGAETNASPLATAKGEPAPAMAKPAAPSDWQAQLEAMKAKIARLESERDQLRSENAQLADARNGLEADKSLLQAKLKEALTLQPAAVDPAELARARQQVKSLEKENDLLKVSLEKEKSKPASVADAKALESAQKNIVELNQKLAAETERANKLEQQRQSLESKLAALPQTKENESALEKTRKKLADAERQLATQEELATKWQQERAALKERVKVATSSGSAEALRAENELLKKQLAQAKTARKGKSSDVQRQLAEAEARIAALESDKELLRLEKVALENRTKQLAAGASAPVNAAAAPPTSKPGDLARIQKLEREKFDLEQKLQAAYKQAYSRKNQGNSERVQELETKLEKLQARLDSFEARQVPFTTEELALFKKPEPKLADDPKPVKKSVQQLSPEAANLVIEARTFFSSGQYEKAEDNYQKVLQKDDKNVAALANLASIELERNRFELAQSNVLQALTLDPDDAYSLSVLGNLKFRQGKYDEALDALSRAAKLDPDNAEIQNYLGLTLSEKGLRGPAETALRKAIQLEPGYGSAHNNLAVIYLTQQPPAVELARWHYQRALAAGNPRNPELEKMLESKK